MTDAYLTSSIEILERTPSVVTDMLRGLSDDWIRQNEGPGTWAPYDILGHLIHGEKTDWVPRMKIILSDSKDKQFKPFDREAQFEESKGMTVDQLLDNFRLLRAQNILELRSWHLGDAEFAREGVHPALGKVTLSQVLAAWVCHDLTHIAQIARIFAFQYRQAVGPFMDYLRILQTPETMKGYEDAKKAYKRPE